MSEVHEFLKDALTSAQWEARQAAEGRDRLVVCRDIEGPHDGTVTCFCDPVILEADTGWRDWSHEDLYRRVVAAMAR